jgi:hypothetical protein
MYLMRAADRPLTPPLPPFRYLCDPGYYGSSEGNTDATCDGKCDFGHYCPAGSVKAKQIECGGNAFYCPGGEGTRRAVDVGYVDAGAASSVGWTSSEWSEAPSPRAQHGNGEQHQGGARGVDSSGRDQLPRQKQKLALTHALRRYYSIGGQLDVALRGRRDVGNNTMSRQTPCLPGHWCEEGIIYQCPEGTWGHIYGMREETDCR